MKDIIDRLLEMKDTEGIIDRLLEMKDRKGIIGLCCLGIILLIAIGGLVSPDGTVFENRYFSF